MPTIFIIAIALIVAVTRIAFDMVKQNDRKQGLILNDSEYTVFGTLKNIFKSPEKRLASETREPFVSYLRRTRKKEYRLFIIIFAASAVISAGIGLISKDPMVVSELILAGIILVFGLTGNFILFLTISVYIGINIYIGLTNGIFTPFVPLAGCIAFSAFYIKGYFAYKAFYN